MLYDHFFCFNSFSFLIMDWKNTINKNHFNPLIPGGNKKVIHTWKQTCSF